MKNRITTTVTHTGEKFAKLFHNIVKKYDIVDQLHTIMAKNPLVNTKMATELHLRVPSFNTKLNLLGCVAHVINLAAEIVMAFRTPWTLALHLGENNLHLNQQLLYKPPPNVCGVPAKINQYLKEDIEPKGVKVLTYWANQRKTFPHLAKIACCFLLIPATSAAFERVFSNGRWIGSWQQAALQPASIEELLCLKDWFQAFNGPF
ncbi:uncharacterized protein VP01_1759g1 [Puccinia sorghi]|uniref:HAT C-terminal dimerisation domain-containing protein n=1 Tax=Puccinia sorghi TaxID=27349 RepID=A0A0L6VFJ0_9BASI|nr:uncharacterized protein VP01_1759g1 [Puccinia sorghi]